MYCNITDAVIFGPECDGFVVESGTRNRRGGGAGVTAAEERGREWKGAVRHTEVGVVSS